MITPEKHLTSRVSDAIACYLLGVADADSVLRYIDLKFEQFCVEHAGDLSKSEFCDRLSIVNQVLSSTATLKDNHVSN